jgi:hypothetical protein
VHPTGARRGRRGMARIRTLLGLPCSSLPRRGSPWHRAWYSLVEPRAPRAQVLAIRFVGRSSYGSGHFAVKGVKITFHSGCGPVVLVDEAAEAIAALDVVLRLRRCSGLRQLECESAVGALAVVVLGVDA